MKLNLENFNIRKSKPIIYGNAGLPENVERYNLKGMEMIGIEGTKTKNIEISLSGNVEETKMIFMKEKRKRIDGDVEEL